MGLEIIKATTEMADEIGVIGFLSWNAAYGGIVPDDFLSAYTPEKRANSLRKALPSRPEEYFLFKADGLSIGFAIIGPPQDSWPSIKVGEIHALYFIPDSWGQGYAKEAISFCLFRLKELGYLRVVLWVLSANQRARSFYEKHGFKSTTQQRDITIGIPLSEICYSLVFC